MRIAFFTDTFLPQVNGVATSIAHFAKELGSRGHQVMIVCPMPKGKKRDWSARNVRIVDLPSIPAMFYPEFRISPFVGLPKALLAIRKFKPDVIHFHTTLLVAVDALIAAKIFGKPLVGTNHILLTHKNNEYLSFVAGNPRLRKYLTSAVLSYSLAFYGACDVRIAPSRMLIDGLKSYGYRKKIDYLPNAVPAPKKRTLTARERKALKKKYGLKEKVILHVGRLSAEKSVDDVLKAFARVRSRRDDVTLLIVGDGPHRKVLQNLAKKLKIAGDTVFTGFIPPSELLESGVLPASDVFVTASTMESQGMVLVEAMAFGLPLVAVAEGAVPEVVGDSGVLVKKNNVKAIADALEKILQNTSHRKLMSRKSLRRYRRFSLDAMTDRLIALYRTAISENLDQPRSVTKLKKSITSRYSAVRAAFRRQISE